MKHTEEEKRQFSVAQELSRLNDLPGTIAVLKALVTKRPGSALFCATYANALKESGDLDGALEYFRRAVRIAPINETYSLGFFHCLWIQGKRDEALEETKRFMTISDSADYMEIVREINKP